MFDPKKASPVLIGLLVVIFSLFPQPLFASQKQYFDYGPYYSTPQVLGLSLSSLENLPKPDIPDNLMPAPAKGLLPDNPFYVFERTWENTQLIFTFDPLKKERLRLDFAQERLSEAKALMEQGKIQAASRALGDYGKTGMDIAKNLAAIAQTNNPQTQELINKIEETAAAQAIVTTALALSAPPAEAENWTEAGNAARDILDKVAESRGEPAIPESLSNGLQELKEQGVISEEESNKIYSLKNRREVREELIKLNSSGGLPPSEIAKLDEAVSRYYPEFQNQQITNWQAVELRSYQTLAQPPDEIAEELESWQANPAAPPSNNIKPYLWYNRAQKLSQEVDLYPSPSPTPIAPTNEDSTTAAPASADQPATPAADASPTPAPTPVPADPYLQDPGTLPGQPTYIIKQLGEGVSLALTFDPTAKTRLKIEHAERRLAEAAGLANNPNKDNLYQSTLTAYQQTVTDASNRVKNLPEGKDAKRAAEKLETQAARHEVIFEKGLLPPPAKNPDLLAEMIKTAEDAMDKSADALNRPALPPALASRLGDLKAQGLVLEEEVEDLTRSASREEVREKIRELVEQKGFPLADAKKLDEAQSKISPTDYNQLVEVRKVEELQNLRAVQTDLAQTPTLKSQATTLGQQETTLSNSIDTTVIKPEDLGDRKNLIKAYEKLAAIPRPINSGQFGPEATPGAGLTTATPSRQDAVLTTCPEGAVFKQLEGCVWAETGRKINDYDQYKCDGPRQYYSFAAEKCVTYEPGQGFREDAQPICPVGYNWSWQTQSCQTSSGSILPYPNPSGEPEPKDDKEREERSKSCPEGSSYQAPNGCVWDKDGKSVYDSEKYRCGRGQYYSFDQQKCVTAPKEGESYPKDTTPTCKKEGTYWNWSQGRCLKPEKSSDQGQITVDEIKPASVTPDSPFYFFKQVGEGVQRVLAFTPQAKEQVVLAQAKERLAEAISASQKNNEEGVKNALTSYTVTMQNLVSDLSKAQLNQNAKAEIGELLSRQAAEQNLLLQKLQALAPKEQDTAINAAISTSILGVDKAADIAGQSPIPDEIKSKIESLPERMIAEEDKKKLLETDSRVDVRLKLTGLISNGGLTQTDTGFLNEDFAKIDQDAKIKVEELKKLEEIATATESKEEIVEKIEKNENIVQKLQEFEKTFEAGKEIPAEIRPYVRLTRINEVAQTVRPDIVKLEGFQNRKDVLLAVATLQEEFKPTRESWRQVEDFRRRNPGAFLPPELARIEALSYSLGVRNQAGPCYLPTPPFAPNTPCPAPGAAIPITSYAAYNTSPTFSGGPGYSGVPSTDKDGKPLVYGQGPKPENAGVCPSDYHWMYDSGGWCMSNSGNYNSSYTYTPSGTGSGYTPYSPYYTAPGAPPSTYGYPVGDNSPNDGCPFGYDSDGRGNCIPNSYPASGYSYSAPSYYGSAPTYYTTTPPAGTVPGSGPRPTAPGQCPSGYHWMSDSGGWCMADGPTYVPGAPAGSYPTGTATSSTPPSGGYNCGSQPYDPVTKRCKDGACPGGFDWDGSKCVTRGYSSGSYSGGIYSGSSYPSCPPGQYYSNGTCVNSSTSSSPSSYQYGCTPGYYWNGSKCTAGSYEGSGWSDTAARSGTYCQPPSSGCGSNSYWDYGSCSCRTSTVSSGGSSGSCPSGSHWMNENGGYCMQDSAPSGSSGGSTSSGGGSSSVSCPSGYHPMDNSWCMSDAERDGGSSNGGGSTSTSTTTSEPATTTTESAPPPSTSTSTESAPPPAPTTTESAPPPTESAPPPTESAPPPTESAPAPSP